MRSITRTVLDTEGLCFPLRTTHAGPGAVAPTSSHAREPGLPRWLRDLFDRRLGDRYDAPSLLGVGGMGAVLRARDSTLDRWVAVKILAPHLASVPSLRRRMLREARLLAQVDHPQVVRILDLDAGEEGEPPLILLEYLPGEDLEMRQLRRGKAPIERVLAWISQAAQLLQGKRAEELELGAIPLLESLQASPFRAVLERALAWEPEERFPNASALSRALLEAHGRLQ